MKKLFTLIVTLLIAIGIFAQTPEKMSYQAIVRNASGQLVVNSPVGMQISVLQGSATGTAVYIETQTKNTNINGLVSLEIGTGTVTSGDFATIDWGTNSYYLRVETDPTGGNNYTITGTSQLISVPYALYAKSAGSGDWAKTGNNISATNSGNVGIGVTNPNSKFQVRGSDNTVRIEGTQGNYRHGGTLSFGDESYVTLQEDLDDNLKIHSDGRIWLDANVGIGTDAPESRLDVRIDGEGADATAIITEVSSTGSGDYYAIIAGVIGGSGTNTGVGATALGSGSSTGVSGAALGSGSNIGVVGQAIGGATSNVGVLGITFGENDFAGQFVGNLTYTGNLTGPSDAKLKENVQSLTGALDRVLQLNPKTYNFKTTEYKKMNLAEGLQMGFIAQEVQAVFPELVHNNVCVIPNKPGDKEAVETIEYIAIDYISFVPILTKAIKEQQSEIEALETENEALKSRLDRLGSFGSANG